MEVCAGEGDDRDERCIEMPYEATFLSTFQDFGRGSFNGDARNIDKMFKKRYGRTETQITGSSSSLQANQIPPWAGQT